MSTSKIESGPMIIQPLESLVIPENTSQNLSDWMVRMQNDFDQLNRIIESYNKATDEAAKITYLKELNHTQKKFDDKYPDIVISAVPAYRETIHDKLFFAMSEQRAQLNVTSTYEIKAGPQASKQTAAEVVNNLHPRAVSGLMSILSYGPQLKQDKLKEALLTYVPEVNEEYRKLINDHDIQHIGGGNSQNFEFIHKITKQRFVLKLENRVDEPKENERELREELLQGDESDDFLVAQWADRRAIYSHPTKGPMTGTISVTDYSKGETLANISRKSRSIEEQQLLGIDISLAQLIMNKKMHTHLKAWPDGKGSNVFFRRDPVSQKMIAEIADCKAIYKCDEQGQLIAPVRGRVLQTHYISAPEVNRVDLDKPPPVSVDKMDTYTIGKNLFDCLLLSDQYKYNEHYTKVEEPNKSPYQTNEFTANYFKLPVFKQGKGPALRSVIQSIVKEDPVQRLSSDKVIGQLICLKYDNDPNYIAAMDKINEVLSFELDPNENKSREQFIIKQYETLMENGHNIDTINKKLDKIIAKYQQAHVDNNLNDNAANPATVYRQSLQQQNPNTLRDLIKARYADHANYLSAITKLDQIASFDLDPERHQQGVVFINQQYKKMLEEGHDIVTINQKLDRVILNYVREQSDAQDEKIDEVKISGSQLK